MLAKILWNFDMMLTAGGRDVDWAEQKCWFLTHKQPFDVDLVDIRS